MRAFAFTGRGVNKQGKLSAYLLLLFFRLLMIVSYTMSHSVLEVEDRASHPMDKNLHGVALCKYLTQLAESTRVNIGSGPDAPLLFLDDQSFEKMGALMHANNSRLLGL